MYISKRMIIAGVLLAVALAGTRGSLLRKIASRFSLASVRTVPCELCSTTTSANLTSGQ